MNPKALALARFLEISPRGRRAGDLSLCTRIPGDQHERDGALAGAAQAVVWMLDTHLIEPKTEAARVAVDKLILAVMNGLAGDTASFRDLVIQSREAKRERVRARNQRNRPPKWARK